MVAAMVLGGGAPTADRLLAIPGVENKSLIKIRNKEMIRYVVEALVDSGRVHRLVIIGLEPERVPGLAPTTIPVEFIGDQGSLPANILAGVEHLLDEPRLLASTADIPLLTSQAVADFLDECAKWEADLYYPIVERSVMEARFPDSGRSYRRVRDGDFAGGDLGLVDPQLVIRNQGMLSQLTSARKSGLGLARAFGLAIIWKYLTRRLTIAEAEKKVGQVFGCRCKAITITKHPEICMDVDKPYQLHMVRALLEEATS